MHKLHFLGEECVMQEERDKDTKSLKKKTAHSPVDSFFCMMCPLSVDLSYLFL